MTRSVEIRDARDSDLDAISELAVASKAHWGYDDAFMAACRDELTVHPADLQSCTLRVAVAAGAIVGFHGVAFADEPELRWLFVAPAAMGDGVGRALLDDAVAIARGAGVPALRIEADPNATGFYEHAGARVVGRVPSGSVAGRDLPLLVLPVA